MRPDMSTSVSPDRVLDSQAPGAPGWPVALVWARYTRTRSGRRDRAAARDSPACTQCTPQCCSGTCHVAGGEEEEEAERELGAGPPPCCSFAVCAEV
jgi:hypothetical protein